MYGQLIIGIVLLVIFSWFFIGQLKDRQINTFPAFGPSWMLGTLLGIIVGTIMIFQAIKQIWEAL